MRSPVLISALVAALMLLPCRSGFAAGASDDGAAGNAFSYNVQALLFAGAQYPSDSTQNPDNAFLRLPKYAGDVQIRPDFFFETASLSAVFKPRATVSYAWWQDGVTRGETDSTSRAFVNEWRVQAPVNPSLFLSFGKEKLLWGSSFLVSPSNMLFRDTEKVNPKTEVEGKYLARMMYLPDNTVTITVISETQKEDNLPGGSSSPLRALKVEMTGASSQISLIAYQQRHGSARLGSYGQWTASDATVLYFDGLVSKGTDGLYPVRDPNNPLGGTLAEKYAASGRTFTTVTAGGSYSFLTGQIVSAEFLYNGKGYNDQEAKDYYELRRNAGSSLFDSGLINGLSRQFLSGTLDRSSDFLRRYYVMAQVQEREIGNVADVMLRYVHSLEERAGQASTILEWRMSDKLLFFNINSIAVGGHDTEFNSILSRSYLAGVEMHF